MTKIKHLAIIMDGNNRWAKKKFLPKMAGHRASIEVIKIIIKVSIKLNIKILTLFAFSSENWLRPKEEVSFLMNLFIDVLNQQKEDLKKNDIKLKIIGNRNKISNKVLESIKKAEERTTSCKKMTLQIALDYGGKQDIVESCKKIVDLVLEGNLDRMDINEQVFNDYLYTQDPVDLCIRTSGEKRISNFLLWQMAYSELYFTDVLFPDFKEEDLLEALEDFKNRTRRFGKNYD